MNYGHLNLKTTVFIATTSLIFASCREAPPQPARIDLGPIVKEGDELSESMSVSGLNRDYSGLDKNYHSLVDCYVRLSDEVFKTLEPNQETLAREALNRWEVPLVAYQKFRNSPEPPVGESLPESDPSRQISPEDLARLQSMLEPDQEKQSLHEAEFRSSESRFNAALAKVKSNQQAGP